MIALGPKTVRAAWHLLDVLAIEARNRFLHVVRVPGADDGKSM
jgi:hypothetical protein